MGLHSAHGILCVHADDILLSCAFASFSLCLPPLLSLPSSLVAFRLSHSPAMALEIASATVRLMHFFAVLAVDGYHAYEDVKSIYDSDVAPVMHILEQVQGAVGKVAGVVKAMKDVKERLYLANRGECKEMAERISSLQDSLHHLDEGYRRAKREPGEDVKAQIKLLEETLGKVTELIVSNLSPIGASWLDKKLFIFNQARKRDSVRKKFIEQGEEIEKYMQKLAFALQIQVATQVMKLSSDHSAAASINRADLLSFRQEIEATMKAEMQNWSEAQKTQSEAEFREILDQLEVHAKEQVAKIELGIEQNKQGFGSVLAELEEGKKRIAELTALVQKSLTVSTSASSTTTVPASPSSRSVWKYHFAVFQVNVLNIDFDDEENCIGDSAVGEVWRGMLKQEEGDVPIAFKKIELVKGQGANAAAEIENTKRLIKREAELLWMLNGHPNMVQLYGVILEKRIGVIYGLCNAGSLQPRLYSVDAKGCEPVQSADALTRTEQIACITQLISAIYFAHSRQVVHRDIKSANILLHDYSRDGEVDATSSSSSASSADAPKRLLGFKLSSFESAGTNRHMSQMSAFGANVMANQLASSLVFMAPELLAGFDELSIEEQKKVQNSPAVDIYGLGLLMGEIFLQRPPYAAHLTPSAKSTKQQQVLSNVELEPFEYTKLDAISPSLGRLVRQCCSRDPKKRPTSAALHNVLWAQLQLELLNASSASASSSSAAAVAGVAATVPAGATKIAGCFNDII
jgi:serine/threonine protein kinase